MRSVARQILRRRPVRVAVGLVAAVAAGIALNLWLGQSPSGAQEDRLALGQVLYDRDCASCHGSEGRGTGFAPSLEPFGTAGTDFVLRTGRMPLTDFEAVADGYDITARQVPPGPPSYPDRQRRALVAYVGTLIDPEPRVPDVDLPAEPEQGAGLYQRNCASCHAWSGRGGSLATGLTATTLQHSEPVEVLEAMRYGPGTMPEFPRETLGDEDAAAIAGYVQELRRPRTPGGHPLAFLGPVSEGFVALGVGLVALLLIARWIGGRPT